jgi:RNA polymerase sigma-70 factor, ECF subfamily
MQDRLGRGVLRRPRRGSVTGSDENEQALSTLMARYQAGEVEAFEELYRRTRALVQRYHRAFAADSAQALDLAQETYLQLHRSRRLYDPRLPLRPWLLAIARHVRLMAARTLRRRLSREVALGERDVEHTANLASLLDSAILTQALERIPERYREPVVLHHLFGLSFRDIAGMVGTSEGGARVRASRGMAALRQILGRSVKLPATQKSDD